MPQLTSTDSEVERIPLLGTIHLTWGIGWPLALHLNTALTPVGTLSDGGEMLTSGSSGTENKEIS